MHECRLRKWLTRQQLCRRGFRSLGGQAGWGSSMPFITEGLLCTELCWQNSQEAEGSNSALNLTKLQWDCCVECGATPARTWEIMPNWDELYGKTSKRIIGVNPISVLQFLGEKIACREGKARFFTEVHSQRTEGSTCQVAIWEALDGHKSKDCCSEKVKYCSRLSIQGMCRNSAQQNPEHLIWLWSQHCFWQGAGLDDRQVSLVT